MAATTITVPYLSNSDVLFRAWALAVHNAIIAAGLVQTADTGQINFATVTAPVATNTSAGYAIYRFSDAAQSTLPVFVKIEYGSNSGSPLAPSMWVTVGTASDGAGNLTSAPNTNVSVTSRQQFANGTAGANVNGSIFVNGDGSSLVIAAFPHWNGLANIGWLFWMERLRSADGTPDGESVLVCYQSGQAGPTYQNLLIHNLYTQPGQGSQGTVPQMATSGGAAIGGNSMAFGTKAYTAPVLTGMNPRVGAPSKFLVAAGGGDIPALTQFSITHYGAPHTFVSLDDAKNIGHGMISGLKTFTMCVRVD